MRQSTYKPEWVLSRSWRTLRVAAMVLVLLGTGCTTRSWVYEDVRENRDAEVAAWKRGGVESPDGPVLDEALGIAEAIGIALRNNKQLRAAKTDVNRAFGELEAAWARALPQFNGEATYTHRDFPPKSVLGETPLITGRQNVKSGAITLSQPIFAGGAIMAGIRAAQVTLYRTEETVRRVEQELVSETQSRYYDILLGEQLVRVQEHSLEAAREHMDNVSKRQKGGLSSEYDVLRSSIEVANSEAELTQVRTQYRIAQAEFRQILGISQRSEITLSDKLEYEPIEADLSKSVCAALVARPDLIEQEMAVRIQREQLRIAQAGWLPTLDVFARQSWDKPSVRKSGDFGWDPSWEFGASLRVPFLFEALRVKGLVDQNKALLAREEANLRSVTEQAVLEVNQAFINLGESALFVESQARNLENSKNVLNMVMKAFNEGAATRLDVTDARVAVTRSAANYFQAIRNYMQARLQLRKATGLLDPTGGDASLLPGAPGPDDPLDPREDGVLVELPVPPEGPAPAAEAREPAEADSAVEDDIPETVETVEKEDPLAAAPSPPSRPSKIRVGGVLVPRRAAARSDRKPTF